MTAVSERTSLPPARRRRRYRPPVPAVVIAMLVAALAVTLFVSPAARDRGDDFLRQFRTGKREPLDIVDAGVPQIPGIDPSVFAAAVTLDLPPGQEVAAKHEAQDRVDFNVRSLRRAQAPRIYVYVGKTATVRIDRAAAEKALAAAVGPGFRLPRELDVPVQADITAAVRFVWSDPSGDVTLWLSRNPKLYTNSGPTWEELRRNLILAYQIIAPETGARLLAVRDWDNTVVVPVPPGASTRRVRADGVDNALLVEQGSHATLVWQRFGVVHLLDASMSGVALVRLADTLR
jgi:hypothetical protein